MPDEPPDGSPFDTRLVSVSNYSDRASTGGSGERSLSLRLVSVSNHRSDLRDEARSNRLLSLSKHPALRGVPSTSG
jgi:hypothetical protein